MSEQQAYLEVACQAEAEGRLTEAVASFARVVAPEDVRPDAELIALGLAGLGRVAAIRGDRGRARQYALEALHHYPRSDEALRVMASVTDSPAESAAWFRDAEETRKLKASGGAGSNDGSTAMMARPRAFL